VGVYEFKAGRRFLVRVPKGAELVGYITELIQKENIRQGEITAIGAVADATIGFYDQQTHEYHEVELTGGLEIVSLTGNISLKDGKPHLHAHAGLADHSGAMFGGHLSRATVFLTEIVIHEFVNNTAKELERVPDETTGLSCWA